MKGKDEHKKYVDMSPEEEKNWEEKMSQPMTNHPIPEEIMEKLRAAGYVK